TGLRLASDLLQARLPGKVQATVQADAVAARLAEQSGKWLPAAGYAPPGLFERAAFRLRMHGGLLSAPGYLLRLALSPTEEDWTEGGEDSRSWITGAFRREFLLARTYVRAHKS